MKNLSIVSLFLAIFILGSCSKVNDEMLKMIPADAAVVGSVNLAKIAKHFDVKEDGGKIVFPEELTSQMSSEDKKDLDSICSVMQEIGLDLDANTYFFVSSDEKPISACLVPIKDANKAQECLVMHNSGLKFEEKNDIAYSVHPSYSNRIAIKGHVMMLLINESEESDISKLFEGNFENITSVSDAEKTLKEGDDMNLYLNYEKYFTLLERMIPDKAGMTSMMGSFMKGVNGAACNIKLDDNEVNVEGKLFAEKDCDYVKLLEEVKGKSSADFLAYMPADANGVFGVAINGQKLAQYAGVKSALETMNANFNGYNLVDLVSSINGIGLGFKLDFATQSVAGSLCITTTKGAELEKLFNELCGSVPGVQTQSNPKACVISCSSNNVMPLLGNNKKELNELFGKYFSAGYFDLPINDMNMHAEMYTDDVKESKGLFLIKKGDKNMPFFEYPKYLNELQKKFS